MSRDAITGILVLLLLLGPPILEWLKRRLAAMPKPPGSPKPPGPPWSPRPLGPGSATEAAAARAAPATAMGAAGLRQVALSARRTAASIQGLGDPPLAAAGRSLAAAAGRLEQALAVLGARHDGDGARAGARDRARDRARDGAPDGAALAEAAADLHVAATALTALAEARSRNTMARAGDALARELLAPARAVLRAAGVETWPEQVVVGPRRLGRGAREALAGLGLLVVPADRPSRHAPWGWARLAAIAWGAALDRVPGFRAEIVAAAGGDAGLDAPPSSVEDLARHAVAACAAALTAEIVATRAIGRGAGDALLAAARPQDEVRRSALAIDHLGRLPETPPANLSLLAAVATLDLAAQADAAGDLDARRRALVTGASPIALAAPGRVAFLPPEPFEAEVRRLVEIVARRPLAALGGRALGDLPGLGETAAVERAAAQLAGEVLSGGRTRGAPSAACLGALGRLAAEPELPPPALLAAHRLVEAAGAAAPAPARGERRTVGGRLRPDLGPDLGRHLGPGRGPDLRSDLRPSRRRVRRPAVALAEGLIAADLLGPPPGLGGRA